MFLGLSLTQKNLEYKYASGQVVGISPPQYYITAATYTVYYIRGA